jgi:hypothetical protein
MISDKVYGAKVLAKIQPEDPSTAGLKSSIILIN